MRSMSSTMQRKVASRIQAGENGMSASLWVGRPTTPLTDDTFLEKQTVLNAANITKTSLAVCHPQLSRGATHIYFAYIEDGELKITRTYYVDIMERHEWTPVDFSEQADDVALCFDGTMPKAPNGWIEFKTEQTPWVFWTLDGVMYGRKLDDPGEPLVLAEANCSAVSAVRAMWSSHGGFDFGLVVFFLLSGQLYYRQLINGEWMDAEVVSFGPDGVKWEALAAFRTWDYRVGVQLKSTDGTFYEMFTQFMGIGKQNTEHLELRNIRAAGEMAEVKYSTAQNSEHTRISWITTDATLYPSWPPVLESAYNTEGPEGDWGKLVVAVFDIELDAESISDSYAAFSLTDTNGVTYSANSAHNDPTNSRAIVLGFVDFNAAQGNCILKYTPGTLKSIAGIAVESTQLAFLPENLVPPKVDPPEPVEIWNLDEAGTQIAIRFTEALIGDPSANQEEFIITTQEYDMVPGGTLSNKTKAVTRIKGLASAEELVDLTSGVSSGISTDKNQLSLEVLSDG